MPLRDAFGRLPKLARDVLIALGFVGAGVVAVSVLLLAFHDTRLGMVFLLPVLFTGVVAGARAALVAAVVSFSIFNFFLTEPRFTLQIASAEDAVTLITFVVVALMTGVASGALRDEQARAITRARILSAISDTNRYFQSTSDETAVRARLAEAISQITGFGAAVTGADGGLEFRAGQAEQWRGEAEAQLIRLARDVAAKGGRTVTLGSFRIRSALMNERVFGAAVWLEPEGRNSYVIEIDQYVGMLIELANSAIVRCRRAKAARPKVADGPGAVAR
jgi:K+-sensing histidine kinase KdpD